LELELDLGSLYSLLVLKKLLKVVMCPGVHWLLKKPGLLIHCSEIRYLKLDAMTVFLEVYNTGDHNSGAFPVPSEQLDLFNQIIV